MSGPYYIVALKRGSAEPQFLFRNTADPGNLDRAFRSLDRFDPAWRVVRFEASDPARRECDIANAAIARAGRADITRARVMSFEFVEQTWPALLAEPVTLPGPG